MGKYRLSRLEQDPDYQHYIQVVRPQQKRQEAEFKAKQIALHQKRLDEALTLAATMPDGERKQEILTPSQQIAMRDEVAKCQSVKAAVRCINRYIFKGDTGEADNIEIHPVVKDHYAMDYALSNWR